MTTEQRSAENSGSTATPRHLALIGGGQMGRALAVGIMSQGVLRPDQVCVVEPNEEVQSWWRNHQGEVSLPDSLEEAVGRSDAVIFAVKPGVVPKVASQNPGFWDQKLIVSIAAGINLSKLVTWIGHDRVVRVMPNTPCLVGEGASAFCCGAGVSPTDKRWIESVLGSVGFATEVDETQLDAVTGLSGSGPAYICLVIEALADGGVLAGLPRSLAMKLAIQTVKGTAAMVEETQQHPGELKDAVASPGGTTIAALRVLEQNAVRGAFMDAVAASTERSRQLAQS